MNLTATVRRVANGYIITSQGGNTVPASLFAATVPELGFWLAKIFAPYA